MTEVSRGLGVDLAVLSACACSDGNGKTVGSFWRLVSPLGRLLIDFQLTCVFCAPDLARIRRRSAMMASARCGAPSCFQVCSRLDLESSHRKLTNNPTCDMRAPFLKPSMSCSSRLPPLTLHNGGTKMQVLWQYAAIKVILDEALAVKARDRRQQKQKLGGSGKSEVWRSCRAASVCGIPIHECFSRVCLAKTQAQALLSPRHHAAPAPPHLRPHAGPAAAARAGVTAPRRIRSLC